MPQIPLPIKTRWRPFQQQYQNKCKEVMDELNSNHSAELCEHSDTWLPCWENELPSITGIEINYLR